MRDLIERIEAAEGPSRELDAEIAVTVLGMDREGSMFFGKDEDFVFERDYYSIEGSARELPAYTASLDAAMTLVPEPVIEGEHVSIGVWTGPGVHAPHVRATAWVSGAERVLAATPALALCAAALRTRNPETDNA